jgi:orotidine-5'-phosphate decarboxylase
MTKKEIFQEITSKKSYLCVGLDSDLQKIPRHLLKEKDPIFEFNRQIIDSTANFAVAYKPNIAFYEALGAKGWESLARTIDYIPKNCFTIADAKRGDIGNTSSLYARTYFDKNSSGMEFDAVTVAPYMGRDSVQPFLEFDGKWVILLALTSNIGSEDFQQLEVGTEMALGEYRNYEFLYEKVIKLSKSWANSDKMMYVIGATQADKLLKIRELAPENFFLVPGVGAQGGSLQEVSRYGMNSECGLLVNSSRAIIYASSGEDFAKKANQEAKKVQQEMEDYLGKYCH